MPGRLGHKTGDRDMESVVIHFSCGHVSGILNKWYLCFLVNALPLNGHSKKMLRSFVGDCPCVSTLTN